MLAQPVGIRSACRQRFEGPARAWRRKTEGPIPNRDRAVVAHGATSLVPLFTGASAEPHERRSSKKAWFAWPTSIRCPSGSRK
jgi:hypothetical protein